MTVGWFLKTMVYYVGTYYNKSLVCTWNRLILTIGKEIGTWLAIKSVYKHNDDKTMSYYTNNFTLLKHVILSQPDNMITSVTTQVQWGGNLRYYWVHCFISKHVTKTSRFILS